MRPKNGPQTSEPLGEEFPAKPGMATRPLWQPWTPARRPCGKSALAKGCPQLQSKDNGSRRQRLWPENCYLDQSLDRTRTWSMVLQ